MVANLTDDMKAVVRAAHLCVAATVNADGKPHVSPRGTIRVWDDNHLFFLDIASPGTRANVERDPWIEINVVDTLSRRGYRFGGRATIHRGDEVFREAAARVFEEEGGEYPVDAVVLVTIEQAAALTSPGYLRVSDERSMRSAWRMRRAILEREFERHLAGLGAESPAPEAGGAPVKPVIAAADLERVDIRVGTIRAVEEVPGSSKLVRLTVDFGSFTRTILAGMKKERSEPREIEGRQALFVVNLAPRVMAGAVSEGMLFDIGYADGITPVLAVPEAPVPDGVRAG